MAAQAPPGRRVVHINMDETAIRFWEKSAVDGYVVVPPKMVRKHFLERENGATLAERRAVCSLVAFAADDAVVHAMLPQILVVNSHTVTAADERALKETLMDSRTHFLLRRNSAWANGDLLLEILKLLRATLGEERERIHPLLQLDCSPVHATERVARAAARNGFFLHFVPANMTGSLQPLDAYVFSNFKRVIREEFEEERLKSLTAHVSPRAVLLLTFRAVKLTIQRSAWSHAFLGCGFGGDQLQLGQRLRRRLEWPDGCPTVASDLPSLEELQRIWTRNRIIPIGWLFHLVIHSGSESVRGHDVNDGPEDLPEAPKSVWHGRLRGSSSFLSDRGSDNVASSHSAWTPPLPLPPTEPPPLTAAAAAAAPPRSSLLPSGMAEQPLATGSHLPRRRLPVGRPLLPRRRSRELPAPASMPEFKS